MANMQSIVKLLDSKIRLAALEHNDQEAMVDLFKKFNLDSGVAVYNWSPDNGLYRLGIEHIFIPKTRQPSDALSYIASSRHYGVYLLNDFQSKLELPSLQKILAKIATQTVENERLVLFLGENVDVPAPLQQWVAKITYKQAKARKQA